jgi:cytochrome c-type biogenesis protein CcmH/NrfG
MGRPVSVGRTFNEDTLARITRIHEDVVRTCPTSVVTQCHLGDLYWYAARLSEALGAYDTAGRLAPRLSGAHTRAGYCLLGLGKVERARNASRWRAARPP